MKKLNVTNPTDAQLKAFKNEVGVLRYVYAWLDQTNVNSLHTEITS